jgi:membrane-associated phospholipid phosphatase
VASAIALAFRKWILALSLLISGAGVYLLAKVLKGIVDRGRPAAILTEVIEREGFSPNSLGYPSGHAAVAWAITIILLAYVGRPWQIATIVVAIFVPLVRMYVAAHLPLDLIGGAALGVTVASAVNLVFGVPVRTRAEEIRAGPAQRDTSTGRATGQRGSGAGALSFLRIATSTIEGSAISHALTEADSTHRAQRGSVRPLSFPASS